MSTFIKLLPLELDEVKEYREPDMPVAEEDHIVGDMSESLKKLWTLWKQTAYTASSLTLQLRYGEQNVSKGQIYELDAKAEALRGLFWIALNDEFELWDKIHVGVRKGFKVVWNEEEMPHIPPFLKGLMGID
ncbi:unnamed protein product [marine sediment metagenome]|uniref:Uncharacterized protein n=1 Tax=marine sediment metagenome TaxID=412755 RepID=X1KGE4_9ZZZZ